jgi:nucleoid DNA-binding protein
MTKRELIDRVYRRRGEPAGLTKKAVADIVDGVFSELGDYFIKEKVTRNQKPRFTYPGFGTFAKKKRGARTCLHPQTGKPITIAASHTLSFNIGNQLKSLLNGK